MSFSRSTGRDPRPSRALLAVAVLLGVSACAPQLVQGEASHAPDASASEIEQAPDVPVPPPDSPRPPPSGPTSSERTSTPPPSGVERFLGRTLDDPELRNYLERNCGRGGSTWLCRSEATELLLDSDFRVTTVWMKSPDASPPSGYTDPLPLGISFADSPDELVDRVGAQPSGRAVPNGYLTWQFDDVDLTVGFMGGDAPLRIQHVKLTLA